MSTVRDGDGGTGAFGVQSGTLGDRIRQPTLPLHVIVLPIGAVIATYPVVLVATAVVPASTLFGFTGPLYFFLTTGLMAAGAAMLALGVRAMAFATWELLLSNG